MLRGEKFSAGLARIGRVVRDQEFIGIAEQIKQLLDLHAAGILTDDEFSAKKAELLSRM